MDLQPDNRNDMNISDEENKARLEECTPLVRDFFRYLADHIEEIPFGDVKEVGKAVVPMSNHLMGMCLEKNIKYWDVQFVLQLALQPFSRMLEQIGIAQENAMKKADEKKWGKPTLDLTCKEVDDVLRS